MVKTGSWVEKCSKLAEQGKSERSSGARSEGEGVPITSIYILWMKPSSPGHTSPQGRLGNVVSQGSLCPITMREGRMEAYRPKLDIRFGTCRRGPDWRYGWVVICKAWEW